MPTERRSLWLMAGRGLSVEARGGAVNTSDASAGAGMRDEWALGNGGTGGGKASKSGELEYVAMDAEDGEEVSVFWSQQQVRLRQSPHPIRLRAHRSFSRAAGGPQHLPEEGRRLRSNGGFGGLHATCRSKQPTKRGRRTNTLPSFIDPKDRGLVKTHSGLVTDAASASLCAVKLWEDRILPLGTGVT